MRRYVEQQPAKETPSRSYSVTVGVVIHNEQPPRLYMGTEAQMVSPDRGYAALRRAHNDVELFRGDGNVQNASLTNVVILVMLAVYEIASTAEDRSTANTLAPASSMTSVKGPAPQPATRTFYQPVYPGSPHQTREAIPGYAKPGEGVKLGSAKKVPLQAKGRSILVGIHEPSGYP